VLLAVDLGNTNINLAVFQKNRLLRRFSIITSRASYYPELKKIFKCYKIRDAIISSVVPGSTAILRKELGRLLAKRPLVTGSNINIPIINRYRQPRQVGQDRLVNAYAAICLYGAPSIVVDFGTAVTFDVISRKREYLGGMILPGLGLSLDALAARTALLPRVKLKKPKEFIGRDTASSMLSGLVWGFSALTSGLISSIKNKIGQDAVVILTGGDSVLLARYIRENYCLDTDLTLKGLNLIYSRNSLTRSNI